MADLLKTILEKYIEFNDIEAIAIGGSTTSKTNDNTSIIWRIKLKKGMLV